MGATDRAQQRRLIQRPDGAEVHYFGLDTLAGQLFRGLEGDAHRLRVADDSDVAPGALHFGEAEWDDVLSLRHLAFQVVEHLALDEHHRIVVANGALEQAFGVGGRRRHHDFESGNVGVIGLEGLGVLGPELERGAAGAAEHRRHAHLAAGHVAHLGGGVHQLIDREQGKVPGHELDDRPEPGHRRAHAEAGEAELGDGRVHHAHRSELVEQPAAHLVCALIDPDFLSHEKDVGVALHLLTEGSVEGISVGQDRHENCVNGKR